MDIDEQIRINAKYLVKNSGINQKDVAQKIGIAPASLSMMLSGKAPLPNIRLRQIIDLFPEDDYAIKIKKLLMEKYKLDLGVEEFIYDQLSQHSGKKLFSLMKLIEKKKDEMAKLLREAIDLRKADKENEASIIEEKAYAEKKEIDELNAELAAALSDKSAGKTTPQAAPKASHELALVKHGDLHQIPVISFCQAASYDVTAEPIDAFLKDCSDETIDCTIEPRNGYFALRVEGDSMSPVLPDGTIVYVAGGEYPERGDLVAAKIRETGQVVVKKYHRKDNVIRLESINPAGNNFEWHSKEQFGYAEWMYPVIEYVVQARKQRWERYKNGKK
jgi:SOS-response transcriptional repressor LexA/DNA-binding Xre family transcriptional regulator